MLNSLYRHRLFGALGICILALIGLYFARIAVMPSFLFGSYRLSDMRANDNQIEFYRLPFEFKGENRYAAVKLHLRLPSHHATEFELFADDCIEMIKVNGADIQGAALPFCGGGHVVSFEKQARKGLNTLLFTLRNEQGPGRFDIRVSAEEWYMGFFALAFIVILFGFAVFYGLRLKLCNREFALLLLFVAGIAIRCLYCFATPYWSRSYDWFDHLDYVKYMTQQWEVPPAAAGMQFHQPPFYYAISALLLQGAKHFGVRYYDFISQLQLFSLLLSIGSLALGFWLLSLLPKIRHDTKLSLLFGSIVAFAPGSVFFASRISNDPLAEFLGILAVCFLIKWWHEQSSRSWYLFNIFAALGLITKLTVLPVLGTGLALVGLKRDASPEEKARLLLAPVLAVAILSGWYFVDRQQEMRNIMPHKPIVVNEGLRIDNGGFNFLVFNPISFLEHPFNDSWNDEARRQYFWEYLYKSFFFGEFEFSYIIDFLIQSMLFMGLLLIPLAVWGIVVSVRENWRIAQPLCLLSTLLVVALLVWRLLLEVSPTQDFRLISIGIIPLAYFCARAVEGIPEPGKLPALIAAAVSPVLWLLFLLSLCF